MKKAAENVERDMRKKVKKEEGKEGKAERKAKKKERKEKRFMKKLAERHACSLCPGQSISPADFARLSAPLRACPCGHVKVAIPCCIADARRSSEGDEKRGGEKGRKEKSVESKCRKKAQRMSAGSGCGVRSPVATRMGHHRGTRSVQKPDSSSSSSSSSDSD